jgi:hypothetical protein
MVHRELPAHQVVDALRHLPPLRGEQRALLAEGRFEGAIGEASLRPNESIDLEAGLHHLILSQRSIP